MQDNAKTLKAYSQHVQEYVAGTPQEVKGAFQEWIDSALSLIPQKATFLELGSAFGRDADYIESKGYKVQRTDGSKGFVDFLLKKGLKAKLLNAITDDLGGPYDMVFANAVFLHFNANELDKVLGKIYKSLKSQGVIAFSVKRGDGEGWSNDKLGSPRYFCYWQPEALKKAVIRHDFKIIKLEGVNSDHRDQKWIHVVAQKP